MAGRRDGPRTSTYGTSYCAPTCSTPVCFVGGVRCTYAGGARPRADRSARPAVPAPAESQQGWTPSRQPDTRATLKLDDADSGKEGTGAGSVASGITGSGLHIFSDASINLNGYAHLRVEGVRISNFHIGLKLGMLDQFVIANSWIAYCDTGVYNYGM